MRKSRQKTGGFCDKLNLVQDHENLKGEKMQNTTLSKTCSLLTQEVFKMAAARKMETNIVFSPFSLMKILTILADSSAGKTREEIVKVLCPGIDYNEFCSQFIELEKKFKERPHRSLLPSRDLIPVIYSSR